MSQRLVRAPPCKNVTYDRCVYRFISEISIGTDREVSTRCVILHKRVEVVMRLLAIRYRSDIGARVSRYTAVYPELSRRLVAQLRKLLKLM